MAAGRRLALISVTDKAGIDGLGRGLAANGFEILSTGGTAKALRAAGVAVTEVSDFTGFPEMLGGRVKTLQAKLLGGILARTNLESDRAELERHEIPPIEVVVVNLYRFADAAARFRQARTSGTGRGTCALEDEAVGHVVEEIDIGGPTLIRAAAKNATRVAVVVDPGDYPRVVEATRNGAAPGPILRAQLAAKAFRLIAQYDRDVAGFFDEFVHAPGVPGGERAEGRLPPEAAQLLQGDLPAALESRLERLRYGENPHQKAFFLRGRAPGEASVLHARVLAGKELSYNNLLDADSALELVKEFGSPEYAAAAVIVKHNNPCGCAVGATPAEAFERAYAGDPLSAFGGILALNRPLDAALARRIATKDHFFEVVVAPDVAPDALEALQSGAAWGKNLRVLA